jgi:hypothetical protein
MALLVFLLTETFCFADSKESGPTGGYVAYKNGIVKDNNTGLEWLVGPDKDTTWEEGKTWVESLNGSEGWRLPKIAEVEGLYKEGLGERNMTPLFKTSGWWVWSEDFKESSFNNIAWNFSFYFDNGRWNCPREAADRRAFAVRSARNQ